MEKEIQRMMTGDRSFIIVGIIALWAVLGYVMYILSNLVPNGQVKIAILISGVLVLGYAMVTLLALIQHIQKNKDALYACELQVDEE